MTRESHTLMLYTIYKPNSKNSGSCGSFKSNGQKLFLEILKQESWSQEKRTGSFNVNSRMVVALNVTECGEILHALENKIAWQGFHQHQGNKTSISLSTWQRPDDVKINFSFSLKAGDKHVALPVSCGEAEVLKQVIKNFITEATT